MLLALASSALSKWRMKHCGLNCSALGAEHAALELISQFGMPNSCFTGGFTRAFCCSHKHSPCFSSADGFTFTGCCVQNDVCLDAFAAVVSRSDSFESCDVYFLCAARIFLPCILWSLENDWHLERGLAKALLVAGQARCYSLRLHTVPEKEADLPVLGVDWWLLGICLPRVCSMEDVRLHLPDIFNTVPLASLTGLRVTSLSQLHVIHVEELFHWGQLHLDVLLVGPPNSATTTLHNKLMEEHAVHFPAGLAETALPTSSRRSLELSGWQCTAPPLVHKAWLSTAGLALRTQSVSTPTPLLVGLRNPKLIFSPECLEHFTSIPGIHIFLSWREPIRWLWSSMQRAFEGFEDVTDADVKRTWLSLAEPPETDEKSQGSADGMPEEDPMFRRMLFSGDYRLNERSKGLKELTFWRLGVPLSRERALLASAISGTVDMLRHEAKGGRLTLVRYEEVVSNDRRVHHALCSSLQQCLYGGERPEACGPDKVREGLAANVRRRREELGLRLVGAPPEAYLCEPQLHDVLHRLNSFYAEEYRSIADLFSEYGLQIGTPVHSAHIVCDWQRVRKMLQLPHE